MSATLKLRSDRNHGIENPVIVLGSKGYIGKQVICKLREFGITVIGVDAGESYVTPEVEHIVLNIALPEAVNYHIGNFNEKTILLNEVYPAPTGAVLKAISVRNTTVIHIVGVRAKAFPAFPREYRGGVPCCGAIPGLPLQVLLKQIYP
jgi:nucleoside-diphosphate-sugar epimerase